MTRSHGAARLCAAFGMLLPPLLSGCGSPPPRAEPPPPKVSVQHPETRQIGEYDDYNGWLDSPEIVEVRSRVRGHIVKVHFTDGDMVKQDQILFTLDPRPFQQEIDRAVEQVNIYAAQLKVALVEEKRIAEMVKTNVASPLEVEMSSSKARSLEAQVEAQKKEVERKKLELTYSQVQAPIAGRIGRAMLDLGNLVNAGGSDPLMATIVTMNPVHVYFSVDERALQRYQKMRPDSEPGGQLRNLKMPFQFGLETDDGFPHAGVMDFADNRVDATTGTIMVRGVVENPHGRFLPGSRVRVRLPIGKEAPSLLIPDTAILSDQDRKYVLVVGDKNVVQRRDVALGKLLDDGMRIVLPGNAANPGIAPSDTIVTQGLQAARINYPVEPVKPTTQPALARG
jgi:membrane fusion protein, multidrug efflux system